MERDLNSPINPIYFPLMLRTSYKGFPPSNETTIEHSTHKYHNISRNRKTQKYIATDRETYLSPLICTQIDTEGGGTYLSFLIILWSYCYCATHFASRSRSGTRRHSCSVWHQ